MTVFPAAGHFACAADKIFDGFKVLTDHVVEIADGQVTRVIPRDKFQSDAPVIFEPGTTIIPGLIDSHIHFMRWQGPLFLANGVTTVRDVGNDLAWILARRAEWHNQAWPRILCTGPLLDGPRPVHPLISRSCSSKSGAIEAVRETAAAGVDGLKFYVGLEREWVPGMVDACHSNGLRVSMHCAGVSALSAAGFGVDEEFHLDGLLGDIWPDHPAGWLSLWGHPDFSQTVDRHRAIAEKLRELKTTITPTLAYWDSQWRAASPGYAQSPGLRHVPTSVVKTQVPGAPAPAVADQWRRALEAARRFVGLLMENGVPILAGTDVPCGAVPAGLSLWRELSLLVDAGMTPVQAIQAATSKTAAFLGHPELGCLEAGSAGDLVILRGDPLAKIPGEPEISMVVRGGRAWRPADLISKTGTGELEAMDDPFGLQMNAHAARRR